MTDIENEIEKDWCFMQKKNELINLGRPEKKYDSIILGHKEY